MTDFEKEDHEIDAIQKEAYGLKGSRKKVLAQLAQLIDEEHQLRIGATSRIDPSNAQ